MLPLSGVLVGGELSSRRCRDCGAQICGVRSKLVYDLGRLGTPRSGNVNRRRALGPHARRDSAGGIEDSQCLNLRLRHSSLADRSGPSAPERADVLRRRCRGGSSNPVVYVLGFESHRDDPSRIAIPAWKPLKKIWRRERDSNPRRAFDPYTLSRASHQSRAVYAIMGIALFIVILSTRVHSRLR